MSVQEKMSVISTKANKMLAFQKKKNTDTLSRIELSTHKLTPGILKIFGNHVSPGSNYKAVRVSTISTAQEVVREALEKFNLERCNPQDYVLCDVIGQFTSPSSPTSSVSPTSENGETNKKRQKSRKGEATDNNSNEEKKDWVTEYVRAINDVEKPLVLQSLWKPTNGKARRFELRNRVELANAFFFINAADTGESRSPSNSSLMNGSFNSIDANGDVTSEPSVLSQACTSPDTSSQSHHLSIRYSRRQVEIDSNIAPSYDPYLLMLKGCNSQDKLLHRLQDPTITVGACVEGEKKQCDVLLYSPDVLLPHCWLYKKVKLDENQSETNFDDLKYLIFIEPANGADITVDGKFITSTTALRPGELITFGCNYLFIFKDPSTVRDEHIKLPWLEHVKNAQRPFAINSQTSPPAEPEYATVMKRKETRDKCIQVQLSGEYIVPTNQLPFESTNDVEASLDAADYGDDDEDGGKAMSEAKKSFEKSVLQLSYNLKDEDELLHTIIEIAEGDVGDFKLTPAYFFIMAIEHSAANFTDIQTRKLLLKISSGMQGIAWEKTKEIGKQSVRNEDTMALHNRILPELKPVLFWLTNALQMLHFLQCKLKKYILRREQVSSTQNAVVTADEELLSVLEEVIMFTFQQIVYHLTKVLYGALPSVLEVNPFQAGADGEDDEDEFVKRAHPSISRITQILADVLTAAEEHQVHPQIISQIFAYLFFFCNALLFNSFMEKGPTSKIFRWTKGVQIRGNIDVLEDWAQNKGLGKEFDEYLGKFIAAVSLLSTPKAQLMQYEWNDMRADYPLLNAAQLQLMLGEYQLNGKQKPRGWYPSPDEVEAALRTSDVLESFATHPPLMLPSSNFILDLDQAPQSEDFFNYLNSLREKFSKSVEVISEEEIQPKVRSDHTVKLPYLDIKPTADDLPKLHDNNETTQLQKEQTHVPPKLNSTTPYLPGAVAETPVSNINLQPHESITQVDVHSTTDVHSPPLHVPPVIQNSNLQQSDDNLQLPAADINANVQHLDANPVRKPPRVSIDLDPNFADDFKDIQRRQTDSNSGKQERENEGASDIQELRVNTNVISSADANVDIQPAHTVEDDNVSNVNGHVEDDDGVYYVELTRKNKVLGLGLIDGQYTPLKNNGIYIRTIVPNTPAATEPRLRIGDRILAVNGDNVLEKDYSYAMGLIKLSGEKITLLISSSTDEIINQVLAVA